MIKTNINKQVITPTLPATSGVAAPTKANTYVVGGSYTPNTSAYASSTDPNAVALKAYDNQLAAYQKALQANYDAQANSIANQLEQSRQQYIGNRNNAYTNARLSAIGNNERLAALGLAGNLYDYARSGTSETSRITQDVNLRDNIAGIDQAQINAQNELQLALINAQKEADANYANRVADIETAKIPYLTALAQMAAMSSGGGGGGGSYTPASTSSKYKEQPKDDSKDVVIGTADGMGSKRNNYNFSSTSKKGAAAEVAGMLNTGEISVSTAQQMINSIKNSKNLTNSKTSR